MAMSCAKERFTIPDFMNKSWIMTSEAEIIHAANGTFAVTPSGPPMRAIGYHDFVALYNDRRILQYRYGGYGASINMLLIERTSGKSSMKKLVEQTALNPDSVGMIQSFVSSAKNEAPVPDLDEMQMSWNLSDADYLYYKLAKPNPEAVFPVTLTLTGEWNNPYAVIWQPEIFAPVMDAARYITTIDAAPVDDVPTMKL